MRYLLIALLLSSLFSQVFKTCASWGCSDDMVLHICENCDADITYKLCDSFYCDADLKVMIASHSTLERLQSKYDNLKDFKTIRLCQGILCFSDKKIEICKGSLCKADKIIQFVENPFLADITIFGDVEDYKSFSNLSIYNSILKYIK
tara:strand:+ start:490 stop:933 length:444 start_codon:yes stop_codon:yes gene_type:complete